MTPIFTANPRANYLHYRDEIDAAIGAVLGQPEYVLGTVVSRFEHDFAAWVGARHCVAVNSGTDAIHLALRGLGIGPGDEVITSAQTALATVAAIEMAGATPVLADIEVPWFTLDPVSLERCRTAQTRAVVAVHIFGQPTDLDQLIGWCRQHGLLLIEDCAQATGSTWHSHRVGSFGDAACFSFYPSKNLGTIGDGGAVLTNRDELTKILRQLRQYGWDDERQSTRPGWNSRLGPLEAAILNAKLPHIDDMVSRRTAVARSYTDAFSDLPLSLPSARPNAGHSYHLYVVTCTDRHVRDLLIKHLKGHGILASIHYSPAIHQHPAYRNRIRVDDLSVTEDIVGRVISLPIYPELTEEEQARVIRSVISFFLEVERDDLDTLS
jgi:dTDP-4-amino-4,6-dideoxygalactose transaminase